MSVDRKTAASALREIATLLEIAGDNPHRVRAFANAARAVERLDGDLGALVGSGELRLVQGLGPATAAVIEELAAGRHPQALAAAEQAVPPGVREMLTIAGLGPKKVRALWRELGAASLGELEYACRENRLVELPGFGQATQARVLDGIGFRRQAGERRLMPEAAAAAAELEAALAGAPCVLEILAVGELRRCCETVAAVEVLVVAAEPTAAEEAVGRLVGGLERERDGWWRGAGADGRAVALRVVAAATAAPALLWATGSEAHLAALVQRARSQGYELDAAGLRRGGEALAAPNEAAIYEALGCRWVPPELREDGTEVELAAAGRLPAVVEPGDLVGALHNHTTDSDGLATLAEMAAAAAELGLSYLGIADHSPAASYANGLDAARLREQWSRIDELNAGGGPLRLVKGLEADILGDGSLDIPEGCEAGLEYLVASVHSGFRLDEAAQTVRILRAVAHPACRVLGHPTGRLLLARPGYAVDLERVLAACAEHGVAVEINASPYRLDLDWRWARRALELGLQLVVNPDAHAAEGIADLRWGLAVARKAGATAADLVNCAPIEDFLARR
jgi:DNA polymerase (family 10)